MINAIKYGFFYLGWNVFIKGPLNILHQLHKIVDFLSFKFINYLFFEGKSSDGFSHVPKLFAFFALLAIIVFFIILATVYLRALSNDHYENGLARLKYALKHSFISLLAVLILPLIFIFIIYTFNLAIQLTEKGITGGHNLTYAEQLYANIQIGNHDKYLALLNNYKNGQTEATFNAPSYNEWYYSDYSILNYTVLIISIWILIFLLFKIIVTIFKSQLELTFLMIVSPVIVAWVSDYQHHKVSELKNGILKRMVLIFLMITFLKLSWYFSSYVSQYYASNNFNGNNSAFIIVQSLVLVSMVLSIANFPKLFGQYFKTRELWHLKRRTVQNYYNNNYATYFHKKSYFQERNHQERRNHDRS